MHINSLLAFDEERSKLNNRCQRILRVIEKYPNSSDRDVLRELGGQDMNMVRPRITELIKRGLVVETGTMRCAVTERKCRTVGIPKFEHVNQLKMFGL
jgi:DNA-binding Lrp family transcriptional regulator